LRINEISFRVIYNQPYVRSVVKMLSICFDY
jgi:hypothetical protein